MRYSLRTLVVWLFICSPLLVVVIPLAPTLFGLARTIWLNVGLWPFAMALAIAAILVALWVVSRYPRTKTEPRAGG